MLGFEQGVQAVVVLGAGRRPLEVRVHAGDGGIGIAARELELDGVPGEFGGHVRTEPGREQPAATPPSDRSGVRGWAGCGSVRTHMGLATTGPQPYLGRTCGPMRSLAHGRSLLSAAVEGLATIVQRLADELVEVWLLARAARTGLVRPHPGLPGRRAGGS